MKKLTIITSALFAAPMLALAQGVFNGDLFSTLGTFSNLINRLLPIVMALALLYFFWGLAKFILNSGNEDAKDEGKRIMIWGIVAFFIMVSVWGIVRFLQNATGFSSTNPPPVPQVPQY